MSTPNPTSLGQTVDADVAAIKADVAALKAKAIAKEHALLTWIKDKWPHAVTWLAVAAPYILKHL